MTALGGHGALIAAIGSDRPDRAQTVIGPGHEGQRAAIGRPGREQLAAILVRACQALRRAASGIHDIEPPERFKHNLSAVRGHDREARHAGLEGRRCDLDLRPGRVDHRAGVVDLEGDGLRLAAVHADAVDLAACPEHDARGIRHPVHVRVKTRHAPCLHHVGIEVVIDAAFLAGTEILQPQPVHLAVLSRLARAPAAHESHVAAIRGRRRTHGTAGT